VEKSTTARAGIAASSSGSAADTALSEGADSGDATWLEFKDKQAKKYGRSGADRS
jgi:hypothetical protein